MQKEERIWNPAKYLVKTKMAERHLGGAVGSTLGLGPRSDLRIMRLSLASGYMLGWGGGLPDILSPTTLPLSPALSQIKK